MYDVYVKSYTESTRVPTFKSASKYIIKRDIIIYMR